MKITIDIQNGNSYSGKAVEPFQYYRVPHDIEINKGTPSVDSNRIYLGDGNINTDNVRNSVQESKKTLPEVFRFLPDQTTPLACGWIKLWKNLNPILSNDVFASILGNGLAWTNKTGWPGRYNCLTGEDATKRDPAFHAPIINGGAVLKGAELDGQLSIEGMLISWAIPTAQWVLERPWLWFYGTQIAPSGNVSYINRRGMDGFLHPVRVPILTKYPIYLPLVYLDKLPPNFLPPGSLWLPEAPHLTTGSSRTDGIR